jgi:hypothetical protein
MSFPDLQHTAYLVSSGDEETQEGEEEETQEGEEKETQEGEEDESEEESEVTFRLPQDTTNFPNVRNNKR